MLRFWRQLKTDHKTQVITGIVVIVIIAGGALYHHQTNVTGDWYRLDNVENEKINIRKDGYTTTESGGVLEKSAGTVKINKRNHEIDFDGKPAKYQLDPSKGKLVLYNAGESTSERSHAPVMQGMYDDSDDDSDRGMNPNYESVVLVRKNSKLYKEQIKKDKQAAAKAKADEEARKKREAKQKEAREKQAANIFAGKTWILKDQDAVMKSAKGQFPDTTIQTNFKQEYFIVTKIVGDPTGKYATLTYTHLEATTDGDSIRVRVTETPDQVYKNVRFTPDRKGKSVVTADNNTNRHGNFSKRFDYLTLKMHGKDLETYDTAINQYFFNAAGNNALSAANENKIKSLVYEQQ